jgi:hypothetical protein
MSEDVSRRKMLSLLGLGAALGFTLSATLEPFEAEAQEAAPATPNPTAPATGSAPATGTRGRNRRTSRRATRHQRRSARHGHPAATVPPAPAPAQ